MASVLTHLQDFAEILKQGERLAPFTSLRIGGPAEALLQPRHLEELQAVIRRCADKKIPWRVLGGGANLLVPDEGVPGIVLRLSAPAFAEVVVEGRKVRAGAGGALAHLISETARRGLSGLEVLVGIPGTVGGAVRHNTGDRAGEISQFIRQVTVVERNGEVHVRERDELRFDYQTSHVEEPVVLAADFELESDSADAIVKRMRRAWIQRKAAQPFSFQAAGRMFQNPPGLSAAALVEQAGLVGTRVGGAQVSDRHANYVIAEPGTTARDVLRLLELVRIKVEDRFHIELELELAVW